MSSVINGQVAVDTDADLVLLKVLGTNAPALQLGDSSDVAVGDAVYAIGNPEGLEGTFSQGIVSGIRGSASDRLLQVTAPISPGSSGGPIINGRGEVVGVAVATFSEGQNLNFAIPASYLASLLKRVGDSRPLSSEAKAQGDAKPFAHILGEKSTDGVIAAEFKWDGCCGNFSFTFRNQLHSAVKDIRYYAVFLGYRDKKHSENPVDYIVGMTCNDVVIPPNLAKRIDSRAKSDTYAVDCTPLVVTERVRGMTHRVEIRVLDFMLGE